MIIQTYRLFLALSYHCRVTGCAGGAPGCPVRLRRRGQLTSAFGSENLQLSAAVSPFQLLQPEAWRSCRPPRSGRSDEMSWPTGVPLAPLPWFEWFPVTQRSAAAITRWRWSALGSDNHGNPAHKDVPVTCQGLGRHAQSRDAFAGRKIYERMRFRRHSRHFAWVLRVQK